jgi:hypothetical protein
VLLLLPLLLLLGILRAVVRFELAVSAAVLPVQLPHQRLVVGRVVWAHVQQVEVLVLVVVVDDDQLCRDRTARAVDPAVADILALAFAFALALDEPPKSESSSVSSAATSGAFVGFGR